ncbi:hypothetical protein BMS3Abin07_01839 [bacterium BMS3Abin07]|nr:hypothetical protein BMS3Abin07_01839 [bacterium BMS3Abin07]GBE32012.1 hypothetical protein BMS3Bbin05_00920 [bacterium BMS3Bbin05]HDZ87172.1 hypothetical protein [Nitrospirota bacterium]
MGFWDSIKADIKKGIDEGIHVVRESTSSVMERAEVLAEEGKKKIRAFEIKQKIQVHFTELGGKLYDLIDKKSKSPASHPSIKSLLKKIDQLKEQLTKLEEKIEPADKRESVKQSKTKKRAARKITVKKTASRKGTASREKAPSKK